MSDDKTLLSRRTVLKGSGASLGAAAVGVGGLVYSSQPALAADADDLTATDVSVDSDDGEVEEVLLDPEVKVSWSNFHSDGLENVEIDVTAEIGGDSYNLVDEEVENTTDKGDDLDQSEGTGTFDFAQDDITDGGAIGVDNFPQGVDPGSEQESDEVTVTYTVTANPDNTLDDAIENVEASDTFTVTVNNPDNLVDSGGDANTDGTGA